MSKFWTRLTFCAILAASASVAFAIRIENVAPSSISRTNAIVAGDLVITNGTTNVVYVTLYWAKSDYTTNAAVWTYTNTFSVASTGAVSTNITTLTPATKYYYRWYAVEGTNFDWPAASTNFTTLSGIPTGAPPTVVYHPVMEGTNGSLAASTNFFALNTGRLAQAQVAMLPDVAAHTGALGVAVHGLGSASTNNTGDFIPIASATLFLTNRQSGVGFGVLTAGVLTCMGDVTMASGSGRVSVGTPHKLSPLTVAGPTNAGMQDAVLVSGSWGTTAGDGVRLSFSAGWAGGDSTNWRTGDITSIYEGNGSTYYAGMAFGTTGETDTQSVERVRISGAGNVGIGTNLPAARLDVNGGVIIRGEMLFTNAVVIMPILPPSTNGFTQAGRLWNSNGYPVIWSP